LVILSGYLAPADSNARLGGFMGKPLLNFLRGKENLENTGTFS